MNEPVEFGPLWFDKLNERIAALEVELREFSNFALKRIVDLEDQLMSLRIK